MGDINKHGLSREIDSETKRIIRQKCGFGCVICGCAIYQYEHVDPTFEDATEHNPDNIVLLCGSCHDSETRKIWSKEKVKVHAKNPKCLQTGYTHHKFDFGNAHPEVVLGTLTWIDTPVIIIAMGDPILQIAPPEVDGSPYRLSGIFCNDEGHEIFRITDNEWQGPIENWDIELTGAILTIRRQLRDITLKLHIDPPQRIMIEQINMFYKGAVIQGNCDRGFHITSPDRSVIEGTAKGIFRSCESGIVISQNEVAMGHNCSSGEFR